jgi:hypothetical protein
MIINTVISGKKEAKKMFVTSLKKFFFENLGDTVNLTFTYGNSDGLSAKAIFFVDGVEVKTEEKSPDSETVWNVTEFLTQSKNYDFRIVFVDNEANSIKIDFMVLVVPDKENYTIQYNVNINGYVFVSYQGQETSLFIPEFFDDGIHGLKLVVRIGNGAFFNNDVIEEVFIPGSIQSIGTNAFFSCSNLIGITVNKEEPPVLESTTVFDPYNPLSNLKIYVPSASVNDYRQAQRWNEYFNSIIAIQ